MIGVMNGLFTEALFIPDYFRSVDDEPWTTKIL
jgi:hypothetical protein